MCMVTVPIAAFVYAVGLYSLLGWRARGFGKSDEAPPDGPPPDVAVCPKAGVATAAANAMKRREFRCPRMPTSLLLVFQCSSTSNKSARMDLGKKCLPVAITPAAPMQDFDRSV